MLGDFKAGFKVFLKMKFPEWMIFPFDVEMEGANSNTFLKRRIYWNDFQSWSEYYEHI